MKYIIFFGVVAVLIAIVLVSMPISSSDEISQVTPRVIDGPGFSGEGVVCCTFVVEGKTRTCAAVQGETCEICNDVCGAT